MGGLLDALFGPLGVPPARKTWKGGGSKRKAGMSLAELFSPVTQGPNRDGQGSGGGFLDRLLGPPQGAWLTDGFNDTASSSGFRPGDRIRITSGADGGKQAIVDHIDDRYGCLLVVFDGGLFTYSVPFDRAEKIR